MKVLFQKIGALLMALLVFVSTTSFTIDMHFCGSHLVSTGLFSKAENCGMENPDSEEDLDGCSISKKDCCTDTQFSFDGQHELQVQKDKMTQSQELFVAAFFVSYVASFEDLHNKVIPFKDYSPPLVVKDIQLLDEVFLI